MNKITENFLDFKTPRLTDADKDHLRKFMGNLNSIQRYVKNNNPDEEFLAKMLVFEQALENRISVKKKILSRMNTARRTNLIKLWSQ